jgi:CheY-like chemotaxis protein
MPFQSQRVLIIDDHASFRAAARELLERRGFAVVAEADGAKAGLEAAEATAPDAVVLDVHLPDGSGIDVCQALKQSNPALVVLLVSADAHGGRWATDCGAVAFLPKIRLASADIVGLLSGDEQVLGPTTGLTRGR